MILKKKHKKDLWLDYIPMLMAAALIIYFAVWGKQSFIKTLPTLVTLVVQILMARANRIAFLIGGANSVLYGISYYSEGLCFSGISNAFISAPIMFYSYFNWKKNKKGDEPNILLLGNKKRVVVLAVIAVGWFVCARYLGDIISTGRFVWLDSFNFAVGLGVTVLAARRYVDAQYINLVSCTANLVMWAAVCVESPQNLNFLIISLYNLYRVAQAAVVWTKIHKNGGELRNESTI